MNLSGSSTPSSVCAQNDMINNIGLELYTRVAHALKRGCKALAAQQSDDGSFPLEVIGSPKSNCHPLFSTVTILLAAGYLLPSDRLLRAVNFILKVRRPDGMWEYDPQLGIPADVDDTACALAVIARYKPESICATDAVLLRTYWRSESGPFQTWHSNEAMWTKRERDDAVVNANVILALGLLGSPATANEIMAVSHLVSATQECARYYCAPVTVAYAALRAGIPRQVVPMSSLIRPQPCNGCLPLAQWLCITHSADTDALIWLLEQQSQDGSWSAEPWCVGVNTPVWGSTAITTAICVEALALVSLPR